MFVCAHRSRVRVWRSVVSIEEGTRTSKVQMILVVFLHGVEGMTATVALFFSQFLEPDVIRHSSSKFYFHIWKTMPHIECPINGEHV